MAAEVVAVDLTSRHGRRFLSRIASGDQEWRLTATPDTEWRISFVRDYGSACVSRIVTTERVSLSRRPDDDVECSGVFLSVADTTLAARLIMEGWRFRVRQARHGAASVVEFVAVPKSGGHGLAIGGPSVVGDSLFIRGACST